MKKNHWGKPRRKGLALRLKIITIIIIILAVLAIIEIQIKPIIATIASQEAHLEVVRLINESVYDHMGRGIAYNQLVHVETDEKGNVSYIQPDTIKITRLTTAIAQELEERLNDLEEDNISFPVGLLTGYVLLADVGPDIHMKVRPVGDVSVDITDEFEEAGINQTKHRVVMNVSVEMGILVPFSTTLVEISNSLPLAENIIVGPIPDTYLNFDGKTGGSASADDLKDKIIKEQTTENGKGAADN